MRRTFHALWNHLASLGLFGRGGSGTASGLSVPVNTDLPAITGTAQVGELLTCNTGTWTNSPTGYTYQWKRDGSTISGATSSTYTPVELDVGTVLTCTVTASNDDGPGTPATSAGTAEVAADPPPVPVNTELPSITGLAVAGETLTCSTGTWDNSPTSYEYQWLRDGVTIDGATSSTYNVSHDNDPGTELSCTVTASNEGGAGTPATSAATAAVTAHQITTITVSANTGGALDGKYMLISDASETYGILFRSKRAQVSTVDFSSLVGESLVTGAAGKYFAIVLGTTSANLWFNTGTETAPEAVSGLIEVTVSNVYDTNGIAAATAAAMGAGASAASALITYTNPIPGEVDDGGDVNSGVNVTVTTQGYDGNTGATAPGSTFDWPVYLVHEDDNTAVAAALGAALTSMGFTVTVPGVGVVRAKDSATGLRTSASAGDTGFPISVDPGL